MGEEEIKVGMITKRAQQKKSFGPINYKDRVFVLTRSKLSYYEGTEQVSFVLIAFDLDNFWLKKLMESKKL